MFFHTKTRRPGLSGLRLAAVVAATALVVGLTAYSTYSFATTTTKTTSMTSSSQSAAKTISINTTVAATSTIVLTTNNIQSTTITATASNPSQICTTQIQANSTGPADANTPVLIMSPGTTALVCVTYQSLWQGNQTQFDQSGSILAPYEVDGGYEFGPFFVASYSSCGSSGLSCVQTISHSFLITSYPDFVSVSGSLDYVTILYTVNALANSTGLYGTSAPWMGCLGMPMAVGYSASEINGSDFPQPLVECPVQPFNTVSVSVLGMGVAYVDLLSP